MQSFGLLCVSPLAEVASPAVNASGVDAWASLLEPHTPHVGAWAASVYRGRSFGDLFSSYEAASSRPLLLSEFGIDAYDAAALAVDEAAQATWTAALAAELAANSYECAGAVDGAGPDGAAVPCAAAAVASESKSAGAACPTKANDHAVLATACGLKSRTPRTAAVSARAAYLREVT